MGKGLMIGLMMVVLAGLNITGAMALSAVTSSLEITGEPQLNTCDLNGAQWQGTTLDWYIQAGEQVTVTEYLNGEALGAAQELAAGPAAGSLGPVLASAAYEAPAYPYAYELTLSLSDSASVQTTWTISISCEGADEGSVSYTQMGIDRPAVNNLLTLHGNCAAGTQCPVIAEFDPTTFDMTSRDLTAHTAGTWSVWVDYVSNTNGVDIYQINIYSSNPPQPETLVNDRLQIHMIGDQWQWRSRIGE